MLIRNSLRYTSGAPAYPVGILALDAAAGNNDMKGVWDLRSTAGRNQAFTNTYVRNTTYPAGWYDDGNGMLYSPATASWSVNNWDFRTNSALVMGRGGSTLVNVTQCEFGRVGSSQAFAIAEDGISVPSTWQFDRVTVDGTGMLYADPGSGGRAAFILGYGNATSVTFNDCKFDKAPLMLYKHFGSYIYANRCFFGKFAGDPTSGAHMEQMFIDRAEAGSKITQCLFDSTGYVPSMGGLTAPTVYLEADLVGNVAIEFEQCVFTRGDWADALYTIQMATKQATRSITVLFDRCALDTSNSGYLGVSRFLGSTITITSTGSVDLRSGANIDAILAAS